MKRLRIWLLGLIAIIGVFSSIPKAGAFCRFYVAGVDTELCSQASEVAIARQRIILQLEGEART
ncbi:MAG: hypothetical protein AAGE59_22970 [Cyanobacteria bacterium P01_F01_bin.86]